MAALLIIVAIAVAVMALLVLRRLVEFSLSYDADNGGTPDTHDLRRPARA